MSGTGDASVHRRALELGVAILLLLAPQMAGAQTIMDARIAEFAPSSDHAKTASNGTPLVTSYQMQIFGAGTSQLVQSVDLGKPAPQTDGLIRVNFVDRLTSPLAGGVSYQARVAAVGPGGTAASDLSNTFSFSTSCTYAISPTSRTSPAAGETTPVGVTAPAGCGWTATSHAAWLTVGGGTSGTGTATRSITVAQNTASSARTGTVTIAGQTFTVTQAGVPCSFTVNPTVIAAPSDGMSGSISVATTSGCAWTVTGVPSWMTATAGTQTGSGSVSFTIAPNKGHSRSATLVLAGQTVTVSQEGTSSTLVAPSNLRVAPGQKKTQ